MRYYAIFSAVVMMIASGLVGRHFGYEARTQETLQENLVQEHKARLRADRVLDSVEGFHDKYNLILFHRYAGGADLLLHELGTRDARDCYARVHFWNDPKEDKFVLEGCWKSTVIPEPLIDPIK